MMEGSPDIVPPTPNIQPRKVCARVNKASVTSTKLSRKLLKSNPNGCKRKRIPNSPDYKKVKQKVKQVTLLNFVVKTNKVDNLIPHSSKNVTSPVKVNLLNKFEEVEKKNDTVLQRVCKDINKDSCQLERQISSHVNEGVKELCEEEGLCSSKNVTSPVKVNLLKKFEEVGRKNDTILQMVCKDINKDSCQLERQISPHVNQCVKELCEEEGPCSSKNVTSPVKVNLLKKIEEVERKNDTILQVVCKDINKDSCQLERQISPHANQCVKEVCEEEGPCSSQNVTSPVKVKLLKKFEEVGRKNDTILQMVCKDINKDSCQLERQISPHVNQCVKEVCEEVASLNLSSENKDLSCMLTNNDSVGRESNSCHVEFDECNKLNDLQGEETSNNMDQETSKDVDQTFSWMTDELWENEKENFNLSNHPLPEMPADFNDELSEENKCTKYKVKEYQKDQERNEIRLVVVVKNNSNIVKSCFLRGFWADSIINVGDTVHILNPSNSEKNVIDNQSGFLVINPDFLISSTAVVSTLFCMRKAVLNHILPQWSPGNNIMMIGSLVHDIFQKSVNNHLTTAAEIMAIIKSVMKKRETLIALCCQDAPPSEIEEKVCNYIPNIIDWINKYCSFKGRNTLSNLSITNVEDIEENIWCPKYGIKGKIDMTVKAYSPKKVASKIMPLELKTGRPTYSAEHIGQVNLYSFMMEERFNETSDGLLLYLRDKAEMKVISTNHNSKRGLIQLRNELASYVYKWVSSNNSAYDDIEQCILPSPINNKRNCERCPYLLPCTVYQKVFSEEKQLDTSHAMKTLIPLTTKHLSSSHMNYFLHWSRLLLLENATTAEAKAFWSEDAASRENQGMCLSHLCLEENVPVRQEADEGCFILTFSRCVGNPVSPNLKNSCLKEGDYVAISIQENLHGVAVAMGYVINVKEQFIELATERNLKTLDRLKGVIFRIDKIVSNSAASCVRNNLMLLMQEDDQANKLRNFIIDKQTPKYAASLSKQIVLLGRSILKCLNKDQQKAVLKALMAEDYFLIKGMPGTGKTSTIVALVRLLVKMNMSVLLTSYTHSAIDNILLKLKEHTDVVRLGPKYRIHPEILEYSFENLTKDFVSVEEFSMFMKDKMVVATSSLGINHAIFKLRKFDVCIVDEASQINQIACLGPLFYAKRFILVGDDKQLPPLVLNCEARERGMQESLFQRLQSSESCMELTLQYRMNKEIMRLCNELTYNGSLRCGSEDVANSVLHLDGKSEMKNDSSPLWLLSALDNDIRKSVCFINTENYGNDQPEKDKNHIEAELVINILQLLIQYKINNSEIGIIAPYRKQVELIESKLKELSLHNIEINTVDQYQGRDKDVIVISCARPGNSPIKSEKVGVILNDEKRLNVAISRARKKLILIGSKPTLSSYTPFKNLLNCLREDQFVDIT